MTMKGLEALEKIKQALALKNDNYINLFEALDFLTVEKELKALEIIKGLHVFRFYEDNQFTVTGIGTKTDKETYDLLKEVLS